ncbi:MAG: menaquinone biosynthesis protein [Thermodesulfobacteriota bacterium]
MMLGRMGRMAYINTLPVDWGLVHAPLGKLVEIVRGTPTTLNAMLARGDLEVSPVSLVAAAEHSDEWLVLDHLCIGCRGEVGSVILRSDRPVEELDGRTIAVTTASATAARLLEILLARHWRVTADLVPGDNGAACRLLIGDAALKTVHSKTGGFIYDLGLAWQELTGLDFVFGLWCMRRSFAEDHPSDAWAIHHVLRMSHELGLRETPRVVEEASKVTCLEEAIIRSYFGKLVHRLDSGLWAGLHRFLDMLGYDPDRLRVFEEGTGWTANRGVSEGL